MFNIDFYSYGAIDIRRDEPELNLDTSLFKLFKLLLTEDMLLVHFPHCSLDI